MTKRNRSSKDSNYFEITKANGTTGTELGVPGLAIQMGNVKEDVIEILRGPKRLKLLEEMVKYDPLIGAFNNMFQSQFMNVDWSTEASEKDNSQAEEVKELFDTILFKDLSKGNFDELVLNAMTKAIYGFAIIEPVFKKRDGYKKDKNKSSKYTDGKIGLAKFAPRYQGSIAEWVFDDKFREIVAVKQKDPNTFNEVELPYDRILHFKHNSVNNNPQGQSLYLNTAISYHRKKKTAQSQDQRYDKGFAGILDIELPSAVLDPQTTNANFRAIQEWARTTGLNASTGRTQSIVHPEFAKVNILSSNNDGIDASMIISECNREIAVALLSDFFLVTQKSGNSGALGQSKIKVFKTMINSMLDEVANEINDKLIPMLIDKNALDRNLAPKITHTEVEDLDLTNMLLMIQSADKSKLLPPSMELSNYVVKKILGKDAPETNQEDYDKYLYRSEVLYNNSMDKLDTQSVDEVKEDII